MLTGFIAASLPLEKTKPASDSRRRVSMPGGYEGGSRQAAFSPRASPFPPPEGGNSRLGLPDDANAQEARPGSRAGEERKRGRRERPSARADRRVALRRSGGGIAAPGS